MIYKNGSLTFNRPDTHSIEKTKIGNHNALSRPKRCIQYNNQEKAYLYIEIKAGPGKPNSLDQELDNR